MDVDLALLCDAATVDGSGKLNILGVFDRLNVSSLPARHGRMALVLRFAGDVSEAGEHDLGIALKDPEGGEVFRADGKLQIGAGRGAPGEGIRVPQVLNFDGLVFKTEGRYVFDVRVDGTHHVAVPLRVSLPPGAQA
ncbi:MAG: hypothetical protein PVI57_11805 [Gemmatimonadota bacterium]|jgi:hypothetical protein